MSLMSARSAGLCRLLLLPLCALLLAQAGASAQVPTLDDLLYSAQRPKYWKRTFDNSDYNKEKVGWNYTVETSQTNINTYDTTLPGYNNGGHTFGDVLTDTERKAVLEYLKTL